MSEWRLLAFPRDPNPYQEDLYRAMRAQGVRIDYAGRLTGSASLNLLMLPVELAVGRARGVRVLHVHWSFGFALPFAEHSLGLRMLSRLWYTVTLRAARRLGIHVVWTAHNVLPHMPVFDDDLAGRRTLIEVASLVIAHQEHTLSELRRLGLCPSASVVIPHGLDPPPALLNLPAPSPGVPRLLFFGKLEAYKGVEELLVAMREAPPELTLVVAGACADDGLRARLLEAGAKLGRRPELRLGHVPEAAIPELFAAATCCVLPFRAITTSGSVLLAMASGRPVLIPDLAALAHFPADAVLRYQPGVAGLRAALAKLADTDPETLVNVGARGRRFAAARSWAQVAAETAGALQAMLDEELSGAGGTPGPRRRRRDGRRALPRLRSDAPATPAASAAADNPGSAGSTEDRAGRPDR